MTGLRRLRPRFRLAVVGAVLAATAVSAFPLVGQAGAYDKPYPFESYQNFPGNGASDQGYTFWPYSTIGKLFYVDNGVNKSCSASVVYGPKSGGIVYTAAHCLFDATTQTWSSNLVFAPGYDNGVTPFGTWTWKELEIWQPYAQQGAEAYDYGVVVFFPNPGNVTINSRVGGLGLVWNAYWIEHWHAYGYPSSDPNHQWVCSASWAASDIPANSNGAPPTVGIGCDKGAGMGGGPWVMQTSAGQTPAYVNSVSAYTYDNTDLYGPYFDSNADRMFSDMEAVT
jgi:hypothetical protein